MNQKQKEYFREYYARKYREEFKPAYDAFIKLYPFDLTDLPDERWLPVPYCADYQLSNYGRTKSTKNGIVKILKPCVGTNGYLSVNLSKDGKAKMHSVHALVATLFIPNPESEPEVNHLHGRFNNHVNSLEWATPAENIQHAVATGLNVAAQGCDDDNAKFKVEADILYIRDNPDGLTREQLAEMFNTTPQTIGKIQMGKRYVNCGGTIREPQKRRLPPEERELVRKLYIKGSSEFGSYALAKLFNCDPRTIRRIVNGRS